MIAENFLFCEISVSTEFENVLLAIVTNFLLAHNYHVVDIFLLIA